MAPTQMSQKSLPLFCHPGAEIGYPYVHSQYSTVLLPTVFCVQCMREMDHARVSGSTAPSQASGLRASGCDSAISPSYPCMIHTCTSKAENGCDPSASRVRVRHSCCDSLNLSIEHLADAHSMKTRMEDTQVEAMDWCCDFGEWRRLRFSQ